MDKERKIHIDKVHKINRQSIKTIRMGAIEGGGRNRERQEIKITNDPK